MELRYRETCRLTPIELQQCGQELVAYRQQLRTATTRGGYEAAESSLCLASDAVLSNNVTAAVKATATKSLKYLVVVGIGGSNLGTKAIYDAISGGFDVLEPRRFPKLLFADTVDPEWLQRLGRLMETEVKRSSEVVVNIISKSGSNTEPVANFEILYRHLSRRFPDAAHRLVVTTDEGSKLWQLAVTLGLRRLPIPKSVGGRYSVLSAVGLFPLAAAGYNIKALRGGAAAMLERCLAQRLEDNPAMLSACILYQQRQRGFLIHDTFVFHPELESLGKWYRQLMGESIGKEQDVGGKTVNAGMFPTVSVGSTDLHSVGQLYLGGPKAVVTTFVTTAKSASVKIPSKLALAGLVSGIAGKTAVGVMDAILSGVKIAYGKRGLPFMEVILDDVSERSLGEFMQFKMMEMMYLGKLMNVNAFDQPNVEAYKVETRRILGR
ncbi:MAG: Glucose-6-phosphate isomerase [Parcubacteria group bacterium Gr01-1014_31]|nr:MAG: Glucose-6-phosphate isomerase [Parcubacteria group bacterium Gr01-1014_31]